jgi:enoyl-CoA hydratase/carnithine racemase
VSALAWLKKRQTDRKLNLRCLLITYGVGKIRVRRRARHARRLSPFDDAMNATDPSTDELLHVRTDGDIAVMTLNSPTTRNAFSIHMRQQMFTRLQELQEHEQCRALVLTGASNNFCAGGDLREMRRRGTLEARHRMELPTRLFKMLVTGRIPVIAAVEGHAAGAGLSLVAASDYAVASSEARFSCAFMNVGLIPDVGGLWSLVHKIGQRQTFELCAFAESFDAQKAHRIRLVNEICPPGEALTRSIAIAHRLAKQPPLAMALLKSALSVGNDTLDQAINTEISHLATLMGSDDYAKAIDDFDRKRKQRREPGRKAGSDDGKPR